MEGITQIAICICISLGATAVYSLLIPGGSMEKLMKLCLSVFFLISLVTPFFNTQIRLDTVNNYKAAVLPDDVNNTNIVMSLAKTNLEEKLTTYLSKKNIKILKAEIFINKNEFDSIDISKVVLTLQNKSDKEEAIKLTKEYLQTESEIQIA